MPLRKAPEPSPARAAASRSNSQRSTGPRTPSGKSQSRLNSLQHGLFASPNHDDHQAMLALGEDPAAFERLGQQLLSAFPAADAFQQQQIRDLVRLYWRRGRAERAMDALILRDQRTIDNNQHRQRLLRQRRQVDASPGNFNSEGLDGVEDSPAKFRQMLAAIAELRGLVERGELGQPAMDLMRTLYGPGQGSHVARQIWKVVTPGGDKTAGPPEVKQANRNQGLELLDDEAARVRALQEDYERRHPADSPAEREMALVPQGEEWRLVLQMLERLDRAIDRKTRIIMDLTQRAEGRKPPARENGSDSAVPEPLTELSGAEAGVQPGGSPEPEPEPDPAAVPASNGDIPDPPAASITNLMERSLNVYENTGSSRNPRPGLRSLPGCDSGIRPVRTSEGDGATSTCA